MINNVNNKKKIKRIAEAKWLWFLFEKSDDEYLREIKSEALNYFNSPNFDPHLTIIDPFKELNNIDYEKLVKISKYIQPFYVNIEKYSFKNLFFNSLYIKIQLTNNLLNIRNKYINFKRTISEFNYNFSPHISLCYGNFDEKLKIEIIKKLPKLKGNLLVDKVCIADVNENTFKWHIKKIINL